MAMSIGSFAPGGGALARKSRLRKVYLPFDLPRFSASKAGGLSESDSQRPADYYENSMPTSLKKARPFVSALGRSIER